MLSFALDHLLQGILCLICNPQFLPVLPDIEHVLKLGQVSLFLLSLFALALQLGFYFSAF